MKDLKNEIRVRFEQFEAAWQAELQTVSKELEKSEAVYFQSYLQLVACRSEFVTTDAAGGVGVFPLDRLRVSGVGVDVAAEFAS